MSLLNQAQQALAQGKIADAKKVLHRLLQQRPADLDVLYLLAVCDQSTGQVASAETLYRRILTRQPQHFGAHYNLALLLSNEGRDSEALPYHDAAIRLQPAEPWTYINRGNARSRLGDQAGAIADYERALAIDARRPEAWTNMGNALRELGRLDESLAAHDRALALNAGFADAWCNKAATLMSLHRNQDALAAALRATEITPELATAWMAQGVALHALKKVPDALVRYEQALKLNPRLADAWINTGIALSDCRQHRSALAAYDQALAIRPDDAKTWFYRGLTLRDMKDFAAAIQSMERARQINPEQDRLSGYLLLCRMQICDWDRLDSQLADLRKRIEHGRAAASPLSLMGAIDNPHLLRLAAEHVSATLPIPVQAAGVQANKPGSPAGASKIRLGFYSADFREHPVAQLLVELLEHFDRERFELYGFAFTPDTGSPLRARISQAFDRFMDVSTDSDEDVVALSRSLGIDVAIDLGGHTEGARTALFAQRAAPIQVNYLGFPGTMGADCIDYILADPVVCPPGSEKFYTEKIARLPHCFMPRDRRQAISDKPMQRQDFGLPEQGFVFCCFNNHQKLNPYTFDIWMRLLKAMPDSVLWLSDGPQIVKDNLARQALARGIAPDRIIYAQRLESMAEHLARLRLADLFLDTWPYNAHTTASDALWAGLPVLTCAGQSFASRVAASLLHAIGLPELVTTSLADYEQLALQLARDPARLAAVRNKLAASRLSAPLFDTPRLARAMEQAFMRMAERHRQGLPPEHISITNRTS